MARLSAAAALGMPVDASADGWRIDRLIHVTGLMTGGLAALLVALLVFAAIRWRDRGAPGARAPAGGRGKGGRGSRRAVLLVVGVTTAIFLAVDGNLFVTSTRDLVGVFLAVSAAEAEPGAVRIEINAQQWVWNARYAGQDGAFATDDDVVSASDVRVPVGRPVIVQLASSDVVHSFYVPAFRVKLDAVPGRIATAWFRPTRAGEYEIACAQFCGVHHHLMRGTVTVMDGGAFDRWIAVARTEEPTRERPPGVDPAADPADARRWGWPWRRRGQER
jgi:cytochrome c oxidase subunit 2